MLGLVLAAGAGRRAALASRTNVVFSVPMLFFMGAASHPPHPLVGPGASHAVFWVISLIILAAVEVNALLGTQGATKKPLDSIAGALWSGFILAAVYYLLFVILMWR